MRTGEGGGNMMRNDGLGSRVCAVIDLNTGPGTGPGKGHVVQGEGHGPPKPQAKHHLLPGPASHKHGSPKAGPPKAGPPNAPIPAIPPPPPPARGRNMPFTTLDFQSRDFYVGATSWLLKQIRVTGVYAGQIRPSIHVTNAPSWKELASVVWKQILPYVFFIGGEAFDPMHAYGRLYRPADEYTNEIPTFMKVLYDRQTNQVKLLIIQLFERDHIEGSPQYTLSVSLRDDGQDTDFPHAPQYLLPCTSTGTTATRQQMLNDFIQAVTMNRQFSSSMHMDDYDDTYDE